MKLWMYRLDCHNTRMTGVDYIVGVVQAESYEGAERKIAGMMIDGQVLVGLHEVDFNNSASTKVYITGGHI